MAQCPAALPEKIQRAVNLFRWLQHEGVKFLQSELWNRAEIGIRERTRQTLGERGEAARRRLVRLRDRVVD